jgi:hypothetical protein
LRSAALALALALAALPLGPLAGCDGAIDDGAGDEGDAGGAPDAAGPDAAPWQPGGTLADRVCPEDSVVTWESFAAGFLAEHCTGCHSSMIPASMRRDAPPGVDFDGRGKVRDHAERIYARAADGYATMPPAGGPSPEARVLLGEWLACGMP